MFVLRFKKPQVRRLRLFLFHCGGAVAVQGDYFRIRQVEAHPVEAAAVLEFHLYIPVPFFSFSEFDFQRFAVGEDLGTEDVFFPFLGFRRADVYGVYVVAGAVHEDEILCARHRGGSGENEHRCCEEKDAYRFHAIHFFRFCLLYFLQYKRGRWEMQPFPENFTESFYNMPEFIC